MSFITELKRLAHPYEDEVDDDYEEEFTPVTSREDRRERASDRSDRSSDRGFDRSDRSDRGFERSSERSDRTSDRESTRGNKVVNINATTQLKVVLVKPERFENASEIADHLRAKHTVVLNLEQTEKTIARRLIDFLSGVTYANEGTIKKVAMSTYLITPFNVEILGDLIDELESNGVYF